MTQTTNPENTLVRLNKVRLSFPHLAAPRPPKPLPNGQIPESKFEASFLIDPSSPDVQAFMTRVQTMLAEKWPQQWQAVLNHVQGDRRLRAFGRGEEHIDKKTMGVLDGYEGMFVINAKAKIDRKPKLYDQDGNPLMDATKLYGGCYVNAYVNPWIQDNTHGRAVRCDVIAVQFHSDGKAFGAGHIDTDGLFGAVEGAPPPLAGFGQPPAPPAPQQAPTFQPPLPPGGNNWTP